MTQGTLSKDTENVMKKNEHLDHDRGKEKKERVKPPTKVVIRRLPPSLTQDTFLKEVTPLPEYDYFYFVQADKSLGQFAFSRAYINFLHQEDVFRFKERFDNYAFLDKKGNEYLSVVEFAPYQRLPKKRPVKKKDLKSGTVEQDPTYISFLESLEDKSVESVHAPLEYFPPSESKKVTTTPLLEFVKQRYAEKQRIRDERKEERRRKDQERRRLKDDERRRRKEPLSKEVDTPPKTAEADKENSRKREEEKPRTTDKDKKPSENVYRQRETKTVSRSYHDGRQKVTDLRYQSRGRISSEDPRRKITFEGRAHIPSKTSETRRSQEFSNSNKDTDLRKNSISRDTDYKRNEKYHGYSKENQRFSKTYESKKGYNPTERSYAAKSDRKPGHNADVKQTTNFDKETKGAAVSNDSSEKDREAQDSIENKNKNVKPEANKATVLSDKDKKWEHTGAKPKADGSAQVSDAACEKVPIIDVPAETEGRGEDIDEAASKEARASEEATESRSDGAEGVDAGGSGDLQAPEKPKFSAKRRASLGSGDHDATLQGRPLEKTHTSSDWSLRRNHSLELDGAAAKGEEPGDKKDPRVERRIRNKDRPAMQIYRPGMLRRGREKGTAEQDSPSPSPSPTPTSSKGPVKTMTFKRSVSREK
ncbi:regulator of nonsense transcripts 3B [Bacillus rossius redtenbacheri]|uniref:regulator of nonsense transcripts 3B n=1 Tax=Bacillus rossius redtenbacheri TaxID=93214 RepID=UPI002FDDE8FB